MFVFRRLSNVAFYRKRILFANIYALGLECANFAMSIYFVIVRVCRLLLIAVVQAGRIDKTFLAHESSTLAGFEMDYYPTIFLQDILVQEAHRHPYLQTIATMYLLKLRYRNEAGFGTRAGAVWRLLFVYTLMPWLNVHRKQRQKINSLDTITHDFTIVDETDDRETKNDKESIENDPMEDQTKRDLLLERNKELANEVRRLKELLASDTNSSTVAANG